MAASRLRPLLDRADPLGEDLVGARAPRAGAAAPRAPPPGARSRSAHRPSGGSERWAGPGDRRAALRPARQFSAEASSGRRSQTACALVAAFDLVQIGRL